MQPQNEHPDLPPLLQAECPQQRDLTWASHIPTCLRAAPRWVCWDYVTRSGKPTKCPVDAKTGRPASSTDPATWATCEEALAWFAASQCAGIGYVFSDDDDFCGVDLDGCLRDGAVVPAAQAIITEFATYTEVSPSGCGVKLILRGQRPAGAGCRSDKVDGFERIEIYDSKRFFTLTGQRLPDTPADVEPRQAQLEALCARLWPPRAPRQPARTATTSDFAPAPESNSDMAARERRCRAYLARCPDAISGQGGHNATLRAACECYRFGLDEAAAWATMVWFNETKTGGERWSDAELQHKLQAAQHKVTQAGEFGDRLRQPDEWTLERTAQLTTDVGNAARLVRRHGQDLRFCYSTGHWFIWDGRRWKVDTHGRVVRLCKKTALAIFDEAKALEGVTQDECVKWAFKSQRRERITAMAALAQPELAVEANELDADPWAFNCLNGTIDLRTGILRPHRPADLITKLAPVEFHPQAACPRFDRFLLEIFAGDEELIRFVQRWHGHCLTGDVREQYLLIYHGEGNNGKSVLLDTASAVMGDYAGEAPPDLVTVRKHPEHPTEIADLLGKRLVVASETEAEAELRLQLIKRLTGNARLKARRMREDYFEFTRTHKLILVTNNKPVLREDTEAVWRRLRLVPFDMIIPESQRDPELLRKLRAEWAGILAWLVRGCLDWQRDGLGEPDAVLMATAAYRGTANSLDGFITECCTLSTDACCPSNTLLAAYAEWCARRKRIPLQGRAFGAALKVRNCTPAKFSGERHWVGIGLDEGPAGRNGQNGRNGPVECQITPHEATNGTIPSNAPNLSPPADELRVQASVSACPSDS